MSRTFHHSKHGKHYYWKHPGRPIGPTPMWYIHFFMTRPRRHRDAHLLRRVFLGLVDADAAIFSVGGRKPHVYYW